jgi:cation transport ATPase
MPSVHTVSSEFLEQDVQTETQASRIEQEHTLKEEAKHQAERAKDKAERAKKASARNAKKADNWLAAQFANLSDESANALVLVNLAAVVGLSGFMGWKAWGLYDKGRLTWNNVGVGAAVLAGVGVFESVIGRGLYRGKSS